MSLKLDDNDDDDDDNLLSVSRSIIIILRALSILHVLFHLKF